MRERDQNFYMDYEDTGFGGSPMQQNEALANIVNPPPQKEASDKNATIDALIKQIQSRSNTSQWTGGYGADAATKDMARILAETGITDINQFGRVTRQVEDYMGSDDSGNPIYQTRTEQTFGNKETGQAVPNTYSERQTGNFFGGTFEGKGNTGYGVQFDAQGNPLFYTQGASSSDIGNIAPLLTMASFVPGLQPFAAGLNSLIAAKQGNVLGAIAGAAGLGNMTDVANAARFASAVQSGDPLAMAFSGANLGGITDVGGVDLKDISRGIGAVKAIESGDPLALLRYGMSALPRSGGEAPASGAQKDFFDAEQARLTAAGYTPDQIKQYFGNLENLTEDLDFQPEVPPVDNALPPPTRSLNGDTQVDEADDFLKSIGINTLDRTTDSGLSNQDILDMINADPNRIEIVGSKEPTYSPIDDYFMPTPIRDEGTLEVVGSREPKYLPTDDDFMPTPIKDEGVMEIVGNRDKTQEHVFDPTFGGTLPLPEVPATPTPSAGAPKVPTPTKAPTTRAPTTPAPAAASSSMDLLGLMALLGGQQQPVQQAPMQDPYAHIKLMEDLFGSTIDLTPAGENTAQRK